MVTLLAPVTTGPTYVKVANVTGLYRHARSGRYYACKKLNGSRRERSLQTSDRKIAERRLKEWTGNLEKVDAEVEKTTLGQLIERFVMITAGMADNTHVTNNAIINRFLAWWPHGRDFQVRLIRPSSLDEWLAHEEPRLRNVTYNRYAGFLKQLFEIAVKDRMIAESPAKKLRLGWKKPQVPKRRIPTVEEFERIVENIRTQRFADHAEHTADFVAFLGLAGLGQAETSSLAWGDVDWANNRLHIRRHKTDTRFVVPIYDHLRPLLERMRKERRGRVSASTLVFKIKDAKKGLIAACQRLGLPVFCQRSLRQHLIMRLWKAGVDKKLIARWQGHQDGGQLIIDTYTEVFGGDDAEYERGQLAKLGGGTAVTSAATTSSSAGVDASPSEAMKKGPTKHDAHPPDDSAGAAHRAPAAVNSYTKGDKVKTACKGEDVEAEVTAVHKDEVQVRTPDGELRWRTIRTVQPVIVLLAPPEPADTVDSAVVSRKNRAVKKRHRGK